MTFAGGWLLVPLVLALLCGGIGRLLARETVPAPFVPGLGLAGLIVVSGLLTIADWSAELAAPVCAVLAAVGWILGPRPRVDRWLVTVAGLAFVLAAWPSVGSGQGSVAGYIKLDDSAIWLGLIAHVMEHGRHIADVPPSTFSLDLKYWIGTGYPVGTFLPVGVAARLTGQDYANAYQPVLAVYVAIFALGAYGCVLQALRARWMACVAALVGAQASLFAGYVQWGAVKEACLVALLPVLAALAVRGGWRCAALAGAVGAAILDGFGIGGLVWPVAAAVTASLALLAGRTHRKLDIAKVWMGSAVAVGVLAVPAWATVSKNAHEVTAGAPTQAGDLGKLFQPLDVLQGAGLWPAGDFRVPPDPRWPATLLALLGIGLAVAGVAFAVRARAWRLPALVAVTVGAAIPVGIAGAPWIDAKILATTAPVLLAAATAGALAWRPARALAVVLGLGAVASAWLVARDVYVAPRDELTELRGLGERLAGAGPTLVLNYEGYATRYFLGPAQDEGISDLRINQIPSRSGAVFPNFSTAEIDDVDQAALFSYPIVVRRTTPVGSRPPSGFEAIHRGRFFEAWRLGRVPTRHIPLGTPLQPGGQLECRRARAAAEGAASLAAAPSVNPLIAGGPQAPRSTSVTVNVTQPGTWRVWVGGNVLGTLRVSVDGRGVGSLRHQLDASVGWLRFGAVRLGAGPHRVRLDYDRGHWRPGRGGAGNQLPLGPVALSYEDQPAVVRVAAKDVDRLCDGRDYDWLDTFS